MHERHFPPSLPVLPGADGATAAGAVEPRGSLRNALGSNRRRRRPSSSKRHDGEMTEMEFEVYKDNGGQFHWRLMDDGVRVALSAVTFTSSEDALRAAQDVHLHAASATGAGT